MENRENNLSLGLVELTAEIISSYVSHNSVQRGDLADLIASVHGSLKTISTGQAAAAPAEKPVPAVSIKKSLGEDFIISLEDGRKYKSLKRHLTGRGLTPEQYRSKWELPSTYPMVAPSYARQRSELAKSMGLGRQRLVAATTTAEPAKKGRKPKPVAA